MNKSQLHHSPSIKQLFLPISMPKFMIDNLLNHNSLRKYPQFDTLLTVLQDWNKRVDNNTIDSNVHAELTRNQFIYTSLMNITKVDSHCVKETLALLYNWYYKNSPKQSVFEIEILKTVKKVDQYFIRDTYRSNMPLEVDNYRRKLLVELRDETNKSIKPVTACDNYRNMYQKQEKYLRKTKENWEINEHKTAWKVARYRFGESTCKNFYKGEFANNQTVKSAISTPKYRTTFEPIKLHRIKSILQQSGYMNNNQQQNKIVSCIDGNCLMSNPFEKKVTKAKNTKEKNGGTGK